jgi:hypothetical protein
VDELVDLSDLARLFGLQVRHLALEGVSLLLGVSALLQLGLPQELMLKLTYYHVDLGLSDGFHLIFELHCLF